MIAQPGSVGADPGHLPKRTAEQRVMTDSPDIKSLRGSCQGVCGYSQTNSEFSDLVAPTLKSRSIFFKAWLDFFRIKGRYF
jgi:hypothetical protein